MISIAQSTGDITADIYRQKSAKPIETPQLSGLEKHHQKLLAQAQAEQNPFTNGASSSARTLPDGASWLHILLSVPHQMVCRHASHSRTHAMSVKKRIKQGCVCNNRQINGVSEKEEEEDLHLQPTN